MVAIECHPIASPVKDIIDINQNEAKVEYLNHGAMVITYVEILYPTSEIPKL